MIIRPFCIKKKHVELEFFPDMLLNNTRFFLRLLSTRTGKNLVCPSDFFERIAQGNNRKKQDGRGPLAIGVSGLKLGGVFREHHSGLKTLAKKSPIHRRRPPPQSSG